MGNNDVEFEAIANLPMAIMINGKSYNVKSPSIGIQRLVCSKLRTVIEKAKVNIDFSKLKDIDESTPENRQTVNLLMQKITSSILDLMFSPDEGENDFTFTICECLALIINGHNPAKPEPEDITPHEILYGEGMNYEIAGKILSFVLDKKKAFSAFFTQLVALERMMEM